MDNKNLLTVFQFAKREKVTTSAIYKRIREGKLQVVKIAGMSFIEKK